MYGVSHQKAGLNWAGRFRRWSRERALADLVARVRDRRGEGETRRHGETADGSHAKWRRITGITVAVEGTLGAKERRKGLKRLVDWMRDTIQNAKCRMQNGNGSNPKSETRNPKEMQNGKTERHGRDARATETENGTGCSQPAEHHSGSHAAHPLPATRAVPLIKGDKTATELCLMQPWGVGVEEWAGAAGNSVERLCVELQISRARLSMLTKEYCGMTAQELVDGFRIRSVKRGIIERLREAACELWGTPGSFAAFKYCEPQRHRDTEDERGPGFRVPGSGYGERRESRPLTPRGLRPRRPSPTRGEGKCSAYFRMRAEDYASEERYEERARRVEELVAALRRNFDMEDWAARVGFANSARLKRACLNVVGRSLRAIERAFAEEVVRYYICAEDKVLREMACRDEENNPRVIRARWVYAKSEDAPREPFLDEWSKAEELASEWLEEMRRAFGGVT